MTIFLTVVALIVGLAAVVFGLAHYWANTPHGRIKPIFALVFRLAAILDPKGTARGIGAAEMETPEQTAKARAEFLKNMAAVTKPVRFAGTIEDRLLAGAPGGELPVRIYQPNATDVGGLLPLLIYFHGGAFVVGSPVSSDAATRVLAMSAPAVVVSVDYRMGPEHPWPAAVDDCEFAVSWCFEHAEALGAHRRPVIVAGDSAGGNLCAVACQRDRLAEQPRIGLQVLIYPWVDLTRTDRASHVAFGAGFGLGTNDLEESMGRYVPSGADRAHPDISPLHAKSFTGLSPACVVTGGFDLLRDEGFAYVEALRTAGVPVSHLHEPAMPHGFISMSRLCSEAGANLETIASEIRAMV
jgi:acetyl esterase